MKIWMAIILGFAFTTVSAQTAEFDSLLQIGKSEFKKDFEDQNYSAAVEVLERAVQLNQGNAEAHYFLGYAYSRLNAKDGRGMIAMSLPLTIKASNEFETVNKLTPKYTGENIVLGPYSKLTSEWGSMAMSYWHNNKPDSAVWAFIEGRKHGGFGDFPLSFNKAVLDLCSENSILITSGDMFTIPLWYLQIVEGYRTDISVIDISLLNTTWYPKYLSKNGLVKFDLPEALIDTIEYCNWKDSLITIGNFSWKVRPSLYGQYIIRGDRVFLSMLKENKFERDIYFTASFPEDSRLSLKDYLLPQILIDKLNIDNQSPYTFDQYKTGIVKVLLLIGKVNINSQEELDFVDLIRYLILDGVKDLIDTGNKEQAKELFSLIDEYASENKYPYQYEDWKKYANDIRSKM